MSKGCGAIGKFCVNAEMLKCMLKCFKFYLWRQNDECECSQIVLQNTSNQLVILLKLSPIICWQVLFPKMRNYLHIASPSSFWYEHVHSSVLLCLFVSVGVRDNGGRRLGEVGRGVKVGFNGLSVQILFWYHALSRNFIFCLFLMDLLF